MTPLLDTHHHLVYPDIARYSWTDGIAEFANKGIALFTLLGIGTELTFSSNESDTRSQGNRMNKLAGDK